MRSWPAGRWWDGARERHACAPGPQLPAPLVCTGLVKAEDKSRSCRAKKQDGPSPEDVRKKVPAPASTVSKEVPAPTAHLAPGGVSCVVGPRPGLDGGAGPGPRGWAAEHGSWVLRLASRVSRSPRQPLRPRPCPTGGPEEQWQRAIHERGEAVCPTCSVVTRKTLVGLKKHMEVCQKVRLPPWTGVEVPRGQLLTGGAVSTAAGRSQVPALPEAVQVQGRPQLPHHG